MPLHNPKQDAPVQTRTASKTEENGGHENEKKPDAPMTAAAAFYERIKDTIDPSEEISTTNKAHHLQSATSTPILKASTQTSEGIPVTVGVDSDEEAPVLEPEEEIMELTDVVEDGTPIPEQASGNKTLILGTLPPEVVKAAETARAKAVIATRQHENPARPDAKMEQPIVTIPKVRPQEPPITYGDVHKEMAAQGLTPPSMPESTTETEPEGLTTDDNGFDWAAEVTSPEVKALAKPLKAVPAPIDFGTEETIAPRKQHTVQIDKKLLHQAMNDEVVDTDKGDSSINVLESPDQLDVLSKRMNALDEWTFVKDEQGAIIKVDDNPQLDETKSYENVKLLETGDLLVVIKKRQTSEEEEGTEQQLTGLMLISDEQPEYFGGKFRFDLDLDELKTVYNNTKNPDYFREHSEKTWRLKTLQANMDDKYVGTIEEFKMLEDGNVAAIINGVSNSEITGLSNGNLELIDRLVLSTADSIHEFGEGADRGAVAKMIHKIFSGSNIVDAKSFLKGSAALVKKFPATETNEA